MPPSDRSRPSPKPAPRLPKALPKVMLDVLHAIPGGDSEWIKHDDLTAIVGDGLVTARTLSSLRHRGWIIRDQRTDPRQPRYHRTPTGNLAAETVEALP